MALQKLHQAETGQDYPQAYHKIKQIQIDIVQQTMSVIIWIYKDDVARIANRQPVSTIEHMCSGADFISVLPKAGNPNILVNLYEWLKRQIDYSGAVDV